MSRIQLYRFQRDELTYIHVKTLDFVEKLRIMYPVYPLFRLPSGAEEISEYLYCVSRVTCYFTICFVFIAVMVCPKLGIGTYLLKITKDDGFGNDHTHSNRDFY